MGTREIRGGGLRSGEILAGVGGGGVVQYLPLLDVFAGAVRSGGGQRVVVGVTVAVGTAAVVVLVPAALGGGVGVGLVVARAAAAVLGG